MQNNKKQLRFTTAGSVDDGKSTLIGRLLYDSKSIFEDQLEAVQRTTERRGEQGINLALLTDGLRAEREQGITIDVAYRYFTTPNRKFIIADTPGHKEYTRNMVTGASTADLALILIDARHGLVEQTHRHSFIASLLGMQQLVVCVNKMDMVNYDENIFTAICNEYTQFSKQLQVKNIHFIPISALNGDNVVNSSAAMTWYKGDTLLTLLENIDIDLPAAAQPFRLPVQYVVRPQSAEWHDFRAYTGRIASGELRQGDTIKILPSGMTTKVKNISIFTKQLSVASAGQSVAVEMEDDVDISRGDILVHENHDLQPRTELQVMVCWLHPKPLQINGKYVLRHGTRLTRCMVSQIIYKRNISNFELERENQVVNMNDIALLAIKTMQPIFAAPYGNDKIMGSLILIDEATNETIAAGMIQ